MYQSNDDWVKKRRWLARNRIVKQQDDFQEDEIQSSLQEIDDDDDDDHGDNGAEDGHHYPKWCVRSPTDITNASILHELEAKLNHPISPSTLSGCFLERERKFCILNNTIGKIIGFSILIYKLLDRRQERIMKFLNLLPS